MGAVEPEGDTNPLTGPSGRAWLSATADRTTDVTTIVYLLITIHRVR
jgi:hypothetical protein